MKKGVLAVCMAAVAALFLVEVSMETLFIHRRLQQTMGPGTLVRNAPEVMTVIVTEKENTPRYLLLCGKVGKELRLCSLDPDTQIPDPQGGRTTLRKLAVQRGIRTMVSTLSDVLGVKTGQYLSMDVQGVRQLVTAMDGIQASGETESGETVTGQQAEELLLSGDHQIDHPELKLFAGMLYRLGQLPRNRLPSLAVQGMKYAKTNVSLREILGQGTSLLSGGELSVQTMALPGTIPAVWGGTGETRQCQYDIGQAAGQVGRFFDGK